MEFDIKETLLVLNKNKANSAFKLSLSMGLTWSELGNNTINSGHSVGLAAWQCMHSAWTKNNAIKGNVELCLQILPVTFVLLKIVSTSSGIYFDPSGVL